MLKKCATGKTTLFFSGSYPWFFYGSCKNSSLGDRVPVTNMEEKLTQDDSTFDAEQELENHDDDGATFDDYDNTDTKNTTFVFDDVKPK